jgi:hypothetical protein
MTKPPNDVRSDATWYRILYAAAAHRLHAAASREADRYDTLPDALQERFKTYLGRSEARTPTYESAENAACHLVDITRQALLGAGHRWPRRPQRSGIRRLLRPRRRSPLHGDKRLTTFLDRTLEPAAVVMLCSARLERGEPVPLEIGAKDHSYVVADRGAKQIDRKWLGAYVTELTADNAPTRTRWQRLAKRIRILKYRDAGSPNYRVRYNLACLFARAAAAEAKPSDVPRKELLARAAKELQSALVGVDALRRERVVEWARMDPGLAGLRSGAPELFEASLATAGRHRMGAER